MVTRSTMSTTRAPTALTRPLRVCWNVQASKEELYFTEILRNLRARQYNLIQIEGLLPLSSLQRRKQAT
jgi:hypothetical protein